VIVLATGFTTGSEFVLAGDVSLHVLEHGSDAPLAAHFPGCPLDA